MFDNLFLFHLWKRLDKECIRSRNSIFNSNRHKFLSIITRTTFLLSCTIKASGDECSRCRFILISILSSSSVYGKENKHLWSKLKYQLLSIALNILSQKLQTVYLLKTDAWRNVQHRLSLTPIPSTIDRKITQPRSFEYIFMFVETKLSLIPSSISWT